MQPVALAQDATPAGDEACPSTTGEENEAIVQQFYDALGGSGGDPVSLFADDYVHHDMSGEVYDEPGTTAEWVASRMADFPDMTVTVDQLVAEGDMVAAFVSFAGTHQADEEGVGIPVTGNEADWVAAGFFRIECGKIAEGWTVADWLGRLTDLGIITEEELQGEVAAATPAP
jgi:predicted ester cyclase